MSNSKEGEVFANVSNAAQAIIDSEKPYRAIIKVVGTGKMLMHCWNTEVVEEKSAGKKNTAKKKFDDLESYVLRNEKGKIVMPAVNFCAALKTAGKSFQDPTSPRKSLHDRIKAVIIPTVEYGLVNGGIKTWDFVDRRRAVIQRAGITRSRPGFFEGWEIEFDLTILEPEYISPKLLFELAECAGKFQGLGDFRPTFGRFRIEKFDLIKA